MLHGIPTSFYFALSAALFTIGGIGVITRRNAIIVFVIMLIHLESEFVRRRKLSGAKVIGAFITVILFLEIAAAVLGSGCKTAKAPTGAALTGSVAEVGSSLYGKYLFPVEIASILLLIGIVGAVVLARRGKD